MFGHRLNRVEKAVARARASEIQAIAIYEAEVFWIRRPERRSVLSEILSEERVHDDDLRPWNPLGVKFVFASRCAGWLLGSALSLLPWRGLCRVQAWAERAASEIYADALSEVRAARGGGEVDHRLEERLAHARDQELEHSARFQSLSR
jgi:demethoxyubiquinone hydroxylase (CLK1/Coq7/Cat5 family)